VGVSLLSIGNGNGSSNTVMVAHLACNPHDYPTGPTPWYNCIQPLVASSVADGQVPQGMWDQTLSSPHPGGNQVLFADGHVQMISNEWLTANQNVWNWQNTTVLQFP
jgi:prepilin-type processing-associated H-X9-DG protein